jgi:hypothetical protein
MRRERIFHYATWSQLDDYLRLGWLPVADLGQPHGQWATLCEWLCDCPALCPDPPTHTK